MSFRRAVVAAGATAAQVGPRLSMSVASVCFGGGLMLGALGVEYHRPVNAYGTDEPTVAFLVMFF